jgi:lipopolysaccharide/colanic/teichoic acid biosynthesis glycosyltransferase
VDELPQLLNVWRGQMTLVGPRMITAPELVRYGYHAPKLLQVKPGLTGLWQVSGRQELSYEERVRLDMAYIASRSLKMDLQILLKTIKCVVQRQGAY